MPNGLPVAWATYLSALVRISGLMLFASFFLSEVIPAKVKALFTLAISVCMAPAVGGLPAALGALCLVPGLPKLAFLVPAVLLGELSTDALVDRRTPARSQVYARITDSLKKLTQSQSGSALPVLLCQSPARYYLRRWLEVIFPRITVFSPNEIGPETRVRSVGMLKG